MSENEILVTGYARLPQGITATELYSIVAVGLIVDRESGVILDADCSLVTDVAKSFVRRLLKGHNLSDMEEIERLFTKHYFGSAKKALITAVKTCQEKYKTIIEDHDGSVTGAK
jgi:hypothetical protein